MRNPIRLNLQLLSASLLAVFVAASGPAHATEPGQPPSTSPPQCHRPSGPSSSASCYVPRRACVEFFDRYFDDRGYLECVERWGGDDGPDDAIENVNDWPVLYALGGADPILTQFKKAWEGHLRQYTQARTTDVPFARDGMFYKEFHVMFDWFHLGEGLSVFNLEGLCDPQDSAIGSGSRVMRVSTWAMIPARRTTIPKFKIIRSLFNGSRGPLLRKATALDWAGDPIEVEGRFRLGHGEHTYAQMLEHFKDYNDIVGDHPLNLGADQSGAQRLHADPRGTLQELAPRLRRRLAPEDARQRRDHPDQYRPRRQDRRWMRRQVVRRRVRLGILRGRSGHAPARESQQSPCGDQRLRQRVSCSPATTVFWTPGESKSMQSIPTRRWKAAGRSTRTCTAMKGGTTTGPSRTGPAPRALLLVDERSRPTAGAGRRLARVSGRQEPRLSRKGPPRRFRVIRRKVEAMRRDPTTPDTRLADDPMAYNPATVGSLVHLMLGGLPPKHQGEVLQARVRYFDPIRRRPGLPEDVAALVESLKDDSTSLVLVNLNQSEPRTVVVQGGAYGEHLCDRVATDERTIAISRPSFRVELAPGSGGRLTVSMKRYAVQPTLALPWDRDG